ncbi:MAG: type III pantothenate kinase [Gammaproteobacteria bacterium]|nr:type III pantothenate kinase [Gammaproteobacteria bacterium]
MTVDAVLCIDVGNSRLKWGLCNLSTLNFKQQGVLDLNQVSVDDLTGCFGDMEACPVWCSSVAGAGVLHLLTDWFAKHWSVAINSAQGALAEYHRLNAYKTASELGLDRWLAMIAIDNITDESFCIIDAGTAITIDVVIAGLHKGGVIMPGIQLMLKALQANTENIGSALGSYVSLADNTADAVESGVIDNIVGGIERALSRIQTICPDIIVMITGGDAERIAQLSDMNLIIESNAVMKGLGVVARNAYA